MTLALVLLALGLLVAAGSAAVGVGAAVVSQLELTRWVSYKLRGKPGVAGMLENPGRVLATANALTTLGAIAAAAAVPAVLAAATPVALGLATLVLAVPLFVSAVFLVPRVVGRRWAEPIVAHAVPRLERLGLLFAPFVPTREPSRRTTLAAVLTSPDTEPLASADEMAVVSGVLAFADRPVKELMTPRTAVVAIPEGLAAGEAAHVAAQSGYSRYPVYRGSLDDVAGVAHAFDLLRLTPDAPVPVRPTLVVPATTRAADLMLEMQRGRSHVAVVLDEYGGTAGLVTFEDLLRDLVSAIFEPDPEREGAPGPIPSPEAAPQILELEGGAPTSRLEEGFHVSCDARSAHTVGGLLVQALGRIPRAGERFTLKGLEFDILAASATRVERVVVRSGPVRAVPLERAEERV
jgi:CBS domain containing-hemolysin-like protein